MVKNEIKGFLTLADHIYDQAMVVKMIKIVLNIKFLVNYYYR